MIEEQGTVLALVGDYAEIRPERRGGCGACSANGACGVSLLDRFFGRRPVRLLALNQAAAAVGDRVIIGVSEQGLVSAALAAYLVPILGLVIGAALGQSVGPVADGDFQDFWSLFGGFVGFSLALFWLRRYSARLARNPELAPIILRRLSDRPLSLPVSLSDR